MEGGAVSTERDVLLEAIVAYSKYFRNMNGIKEIDHLFDQNFAEVAASDPEALRSGILIIEKTMGISAFVFGKLYPSCRKTTFKRSTLLKNNVIQAEDVDLITKMLLCLNGEVGSAFTARKNLLDNNYFQTLKSELHFNKLICLRFKKSSVCWAYRNELISRCLAEPSLLNGEAVSDKTQFVLQLFAKESKLLARMLNKYPRNYYAWNYKINLFEKLLLNQNCTEEIKLELQRAHEYCERHVHDYSSFNYLQFILVKLHDCQLCHANLKWIDDVKDKYDALYTIERKNSAYNDEMDYTKLESLKIHKRAMEKILKTISLESDKE